MTPTLPTGAPLVGRTVRLDPLGEADVPDLARILLDPRVYAHGYVMHARPADSQAAEHLVRTRTLPDAPLDGRGRGRLAYAVCADGRLVGTSSLGEVDLARESAHLGWTLYDPEVWGTAVNPEAKLLLLTHCFEDCGLGRVKLQTDLLNTRSQAAIAKLGAVREGVTRRDQPREDGSWRDSVVFSVTVDDWPRVRDGLRARLDR